MISTTDCIRMLERHRNQITTGSGYAVEKTRQRRIDINADVQGLWVWPVVAVCFDLSDVWWAALVALVLWVWCAVSVFLGWALEGTVPRKYLDERRIAWLMHDLPSPRASVNVNDAQDYGAKITDGMPIAVQLAVQTYLADADADTDFFIAKVDNVVLPSDKAERESRRKHVANRARRRAAAMILPPGMRVEEYRGFNGEIQRECSGVPDDGEYLMVENAWGEVERRPIHGWVEG